LLFHLTCLTATIKFAKHRRANISNPHTNSEREPLLADGDRSDQPAPPTPAVLDLALARFSVLVEIVVYTLLPFAPTGNLFVLFFTLGSFGAGLVPAINSIVLELYTRKIGNNAVVESGKLFGALSAAQMLL
jgi:MFS family permease